MKNFEIADLLVLAGLGFIFYGLWQIAPAYAWIVDGALMLIIAVLSATQRRIPA